MHKNGFTEQFADPIKFVFPHPQTNDRYNQMADKGFLFASSDLRMMFDLLLLSRKQDAVLALHEFAS